MGGSLPAGNATESEEEDGFEGIEDVYEDAVDHTSGEQTRASLADSPAQLELETSQPPQLPELPSTLNEALHPPALPLNVQVTPDKVHSALLAINTSPLRAATIAAVQAKQLDCQANMIRRWKGGVTESYRSSPKWT